MRASAGDLPKMRALPGVAGVYPVRTISLDQNEARPGPAPELITALKMTGADIAQSELGLSGWGVTVAVIDSGIDYDHPDLGGCFGPGCRVNKGFDLVGDAYNADVTSPAYDPTPVPDPFPRRLPRPRHACQRDHRRRRNDQGRRTGRAISCLSRVRVRRTGQRRTSCWKRWKWSLDDGADVLNMSFGSPFGWPQEPIAKAASRLVRQGVVVVASIGNEGALGLYGAAAPGVGKEVIGVASFDNTDANLVAFTISPDDLKIGYTVADRSSPAARNGHLSDGTDRHRHHSRRWVRGLTGRQPGRKGGLIRRGTCSFYAKASNAQMAGAVGVVLYNNAPGILNATVAGSPAVTIPVVAITAERGADR